MITPTGLWEVQPHPLPAVQVGTRFLQQPRSRSQAGAKPHFPPLESGALISLPQCGHQERRRHCLERALHQCGCEHWQVECMELGIPLALAPLYSLQRAGLFPHWGRGVALPSPRALSMVLTTPRVHRDSPPPYRPTDVFRNEGPPPSSSPAKGTTGTFPDPEASFSQLARRLD